jgi:membrane-associated phospholipid phosphatase
MRMMRASILAALLVAPFYSLWPAVGPRWIGVANAPRDAFPSLHLTWALLCLAYSPKRLRCVSWMVVGGTMASTLGLGEHHAIDLIAAVPFTLAIVKLNALLSATTKLLRAAPPVRASSSPIAGTASQSAN